MRKALLVAVDAYRAPYTLYNGAPDMAELKGILEMSGFSVITLYNTQATKANIVSQLRTLISQAMPGESICFAYYGHGGQMPGNEDDGYSECLCGYDWEAGGLVWDREIDAILAGIKPGVTCDMFYNCCFSGGIVENPGTSIISWQACRELEYATVFGFADGTWRGLTALIFGVAYWMGPLATRADIFDYISYWTTYYAPTQHPVLRCTESERHQIIWM